MVAATTFVVIIKCPAFKFRRLLLFFPGPPVPRVARGGAENNEVEIVKREMLRENERGRLRWRLIPSIPAGGERRVWKDDLFKRALKYR